MEMHIHLRNATPAADMLTRNFLTSHGWTWKIPGIPLFSVGSISRFLDRRRVETFWHCSRKELIPTETIPFFATFAV